MRQEVTFGSLSLLFIRAPRRLVSLVVSHAGELDVTHVVLTRPFEKFEIATSSGLARTHSFIFEEVNLRKQTLQIHEEQI